MSKKLSQAKKDQQGKMEHIFATLRILESTDFNFSRTERETGVCRLTLRRWRERFGKDVFSKPSAIAGLGCVSVTVTDQQEKDIAAFDAEAFRVKTQLLMKLKEVAETCRDLDKLSRALKAVHEVQIGTLPAGSQVPGSGGLNNHVTFVQYIADQITLKTKENAAIN